MKIGELELDNPVVAAPMAGVTDRAFRILARESGCALVYTEMISSQAVIHNNEKTHRLMDCRGERGPVGVQIFGREPEYMARTAEQARLSRASLVDINMGCPTPKIVKNGEGAALMLEPELAFRVVSAVVSAVDLPVTVKMRKGWDRDRANAVEIALAVQEAGGRAVAVHGRTREQFYSGSADWDSIREVKDRLTIPVIGNGDVFTPASAGEMLRQTGCDAVMIGRASLGNPWIFSRTVKYLQEGVLPPEPSPEDKINMCLRHLDLMEEHKGVAALWEMRKHAAWYTRGLPGAARLRDQVNKASSLPTLKEVLEGFRQELIH